MVDGQLATGSGPTAGAALRDAAVATRARIAEALSEDLRKEFEADFPAESGGSAGYGGRDLLAMDAMSKRAEIRLRGMSGWLDGLAKSLDH
jgi:hypothetical protein